jgi:hypothetical protein
MERGESIARPVRRRRLLDRTDRQLRAARDIIIISPPISGLSTFLAQIQRHITTAEHFAGFKALLLDCRQLLRLGKPFASPLRRALVNKLELASITPDEEQDIRLVDFLNHLLNANTSLHMVIILDNLQVAPEREIKAFLEQIRVISESREENRSLGRALFVLGGHCLDLRRLDPQHASPFNIADRIFLSDLDEDEALDIANALLSQSARPHSGLAAKYVCYLAGNHPYLLEQICWHLVHDTVPAIAAMSKVNFEAVERVVGAICDDARDHFLCQAARSLEGLSPLARQYLRDILNGARYDSMKEAPPLRELALLGLISGSRSPIWQISNPVLSRFLRQQSCLAPVLESESFVPRRLYANVEGYKILYELENDLRDFVFCKMFDKFSDRWQRKVDDKIARYCQGLKKAELESGWFPNEDLPELAYSHFHYLKQIVESNWAAIFHNYFKPKSVFAGYFDMLEGIRNRIAHNRPLTDHEVEQMEVIARKFRDCMHDAPPSAREDNGRNGGCRQL